ncbi:metallophosphoesterase [Bradyrhizobium japonicum]|uniref:metallophosphoesterase n=1 Tax=Bradyrhizobium japonicum TaxID=375 RepID=UPI001BAD2242|nr:metallophosphoesterase [Bradyrhizobium japonicum]MBR0911488.1 metallophosphoesterase [Bradyrhizobium japonicum]
MIRILHVSDVHFGASDPSAEQALITNALIKAVTKDAMDPDILIFSGDLAFSGTPSQFKIGEDWLKRLCKAAPRADLFVVPGNHDVDRSQVKGQHLLHASGSNPKSYEDWKETTPKPAHLSTFFEWFQSAKSVLPLKGDWQTPWGFHHVKDDLPLPVHIIGLNSALMSCNDLDEKKLVVDVRTANEAFLAAERNQGLIIAVAHHPFEHLVDWNRSEIDKFFLQSSGADLYLHGHLHAQLGISRAEITGRSLTTFAAGASYQGSAWPQQFASYTIDFSAGELRTNVYTYSSDSGEWVVDQKLSYKMGLELSLLSTYNELIKARRKPTEAVKPTKPSKPIKQSAADQAKLPSPGRPVTPPEPRPVAPIGISEHEAGVYVELQVMRYRNAARLVEARVAEYIQKNTSFGQVCYAVKHRVKNPDRIKEKMQARQTQDAGLIVDICGFRIITFYQNDIPLVVEQLLQTIEHEEQPFKKGCKVEIDINTSRTLIDPLSINGAVQEVALRSPLKPRVEVKPRQTGYSSVHMIIWAPAKGEDSVINEMRMEIQIRSVWEDVWGELDHRLRYGSERGGLGVSSAQHLNVFKALIDGVVQYVDVIRRQSEGDNLKPPNAIKSVRTLATPSDQLKLLEDLSPEIYARASNAFDLWKQADASRQRGGDPGLLRQAADAFEALRQDAELVPDHKLSEELTYIAMGERAYLLMYTGDEFDLAEAAKLYRTILEKRPRDPTALLRLGTVTGRQKQYNESDRLLSDALKVIEGNEDDRLDVKHWAYDIARLTLALTRWRRFAQTDNREFLVSAIKLARPVVEQPVDPANLIRAINDLLYYGCEERRASQSDSDHLVSDEELVNLTSTLEAELAANDRGYEYHDTLMTGLDILGRKDESVLEAFKLRDILERIVVLAAPEARLGEKGTYTWTFAMSRYLDADQQDCLAHAQDVIAFSKNKENRAQDEP